MRAWLVLAATAGCTASVGELPPVVALRVEPPSIELSIDLAGPAPAPVPVHVVARTLDGDELDVTADAQLSLVGPQLGAIVASEAGPGMIAAGPALASDGMTGGAATLAASYDGVTAGATVTANVHGRRITEGTPVAATAAFATATATPIDAALSPADGAVLPPNLGAFVVDFTAADSDDAHELHVTAPYLDLAVDAPGAPGPRELALSHVEWQAIARTVSGGSIDVEVASLATSAPQTVRVAHASYDVADLGSSAILAGMLMGSAAPPAFLRYDLATATMTPLLAGPSGACVGCHVAVSADGSRIAAGVASTKGGPAGILFDGRGAILATSDASALPWVAAAFDPSGAMIGAMNGVLTLRDGTTAAVLQTIATGELATSPAVAPDGSALAYTELDTSGVTILNPVGDALHVRSWNVATAALGAPHELVRDGRGVLMPVYSPDGRWIAYGHSASSADEKPTGTAAVRSDGSGTIVELTTDPNDHLARWTSPIATARHGGQSETMVWIAFSSQRPVGTLAAGTQQLWLEAFFPDRGIVAPAFHLPGQGSANLLHGPLAIP